MSNESTIITKYRATVAERKDIENTLVGNAKRDAIIEYIAACDHPEVFAEEGGEINE